MKNIKKITIAAILSISSLAYAQKTKEVDNAKGLKLTIADAQPVEKNGKTTWTVNATLSNNSKDTIYYFDNRGREAGNYIITATPDTVSLAIDIPQVGIDQFIAAIPPKGKQVTKLEISSAKPVNADFAFSVYFWTRKAANRKEAVTPDEFSSKKFGEHGIFIGSNQIKVKLPKK
jgi:hypothetical protein